MSQCRDCLYYVPGRGSRNCNKSGRTVDLDDRSCSDFLDESHRNCYDCAKFRYSNDFCVAKLRKISSPGSYYCDSFKYDV